MAHWAELNEDNVVLRVLVGDDNDPNGDRGYKWLLDNLGGTWVETDYFTKGNAHYGADNQPDDGLPFRKNYAGIGYIYDPTRDAFYAPQPYASWILNEETCCWQAPIPYPTDGKRYLWDEPTKSWKEMPAPTV